MQFPLALSGRLQLAEVLAPLRLHVTQVLVTLQTLPLARLQMLLRLAPAFLRARFLGRLQSQNMLYSKLRVTQ